MIGKTTQIDDKIELSGILVNPDGSLIRDNSGKWINSDAFRQEAIAFRANKRYCPDPKGTPSYRKYWDEQLKRCKEGYEVNGIKITQHHYAYLNFCEIKVVVGDPDDPNAKKILKCPDFWDGDYDYYWSIEIAKNGLFSKEALATNDLEKAWYKTLLTKEEKDIAKQDVLKRLGLRVIPHPEYLDGGNHIVVGKARRKGYSYKNAFICANTYNTIRESLTILGAFDKEYLLGKGTMGMASAYLDHLNKHTAWTKAREFADLKDNKRASFIEYINGAKVESGYKSELLMLTFGDNSDKARGKDALEVLFEESGKFPNLLASVRATGPGLAAGKFITGQMKVFGTGGDMAKGTAGFAELFYNPIVDRFMPFVNIWDENALETYCGFFHPFYWNHEGFYDSQGNSDVEGAKKWELEERAKLIKNSVNSVALQARVQEFPFSPSEAFLTVSVNVFPVVELRSQINKVKRENLHLKYGKPVELTTEEGKVKVIVDLEGRLQPLYDYKPKINDFRGSLVIYDMPIPNTPRGLYKIGFDPTTEVENPTSKLPSFSAIYVYKGIHRGSESDTNDTIVAQYVGRLDADDVNRICEYLAKLYNTQVMYENMVSHTKSYFERRMLLNLLAAQPDRVIGANVKASKVKRTYGCHMNDQLKDAGEKYIKAWLLRVRDYKEDEDGKIIEIRNIDKIYDIALLEELIAYSRKGNYDRVMALMMVMFQIEEEELGKTYDTSSEIPDIEQELIALSKNQFRSYSKTVYN